MWSALRHAWSSIQASFWFVPTAIVLGAVGLATLLIALDFTNQTHAVERWPLLFGAGAAGSRGLLMAVASSMITVAGVVFSITIVALSLTSSQYSPRVLRNFMGDRSNQAVLGVFVGIFAYCLVVLRTIRGGDEEGAFVPSLAVLGGLLLAFVGIGFLIFFIHHIAVSIQAASIIATAAQETIASIDLLFPQELGEDAEEAADGSGAAPLAGQTWSIVRAQGSGYIESVDGDALLSLARERGTILRMECGIGEFVVEGTPLLSVAGLSKVDEATTAAVCAAYFIRPHRTVQQDVAFGIRQIVDIALRALSPGINDTTTAVTCVHYLSAILARIVRRRVATPYRSDEGTLRVITRSPTFEALLAEAFDQIRHNAEGNLAVLIRQLQALEAIAEQTVSCRRKQALREHAELIATLARRAATCPREAAVVEARLVDLASALG